MSKAILIIEIPEDFDYRKCNIGGDGNIYYERKGEQRASIIGNIKNLKHMPQKKDLSQCKLYSEQGYAHGWNDCIETILGEEK